MHFLSLTLHLERRVLSRTFIIPLILLLSISLHAQRTPPAYELRDDTTWQVIIPDEHVLFMHDSTGKLSQNQVNDLYLQGKLKPWRSAFAKNLKTGSHYWFFYRITNAMSKRIESALDSYANISEFHIVRKDGRKEIHTTGDMLSWNKKTEFFRSNISPFKLDSNETVEVFYRASFISDRFIIEGFKTALANPGSYARRELKRSESNYTPNTALSTFYSGIFALASLIYLVFFLLVREKVFLYFTLFLFGLAFVTNHSGVYVQRYHPEWAKIWMIASVGVFSIFLLFIRQFLNTRKHQPKWDKFLLAFAVIFFIGIFYFTVTNRAFESATIVPVSVGILFLVTIITFFLLNQEQKKEKKFLLYAILPVLIAFPVLIIIVILISMSDEPGKFINSGIGIALDYVNYFIDLSFLWMTLSFSRLLFRRFSEQRQRIREQELEKEHILQQQELERMKLVEQQKLDLEKQVAERTAELKKSLEDLKATQNQLIQSEKMASLGEMTAGIAHEIQNPLNFVNNFADVNDELVEEMTAEIHSVEIDPLLKNKFQLLLNDIKNNQRKIREHGKRADSIVKNMLQHSRTSSSQKEDLDVNALIDEYVKLSFHGMRAKDKSFNADFKIHLDPSIVKAPVLAQDFGRVILNLVNNAFYAVSEKKKTAASEYKPEVTVTTSLEKEWIRITVADNGNGINEKIKDKIFQPFFTTKPTGEGTGLGLSISYDIITKGHGGKMWAESKVGEGCSFIIEIPV